MNERFEWKKQYTVVLLVNVLYIIIFYLIMLFNN